MLSNTLQIACLCEAVFNIVMTYLYWKLPVMMWSPVLLSEDVRIEQKSISNSLWAMMMSVESTMLLHVYWSNSISALRSVYIGMLMGEYFVAIAMLNTGKLSLRRVGVWQFMIGLSVFAAWRHYALYYLI